jgi:hypothetical protein
MAAQEAARANESYVMERARYLILKDEGEPYLSKENYNPMADFLDYIATGPDEAMPGVIEASHIVGALMLRLASGERQ